MISTSYDLDDSNQRNSSNSMNDEESIFLSSSSDEDIPLVHYTGSGVATNGKKQANKYMETMINDGLGEQEGSEESLLSDEANASVQYESDDEEIEYIPTATYTEDLDDHIEDVSDDDDGLKPTKIYDEYDPENLDSFNDSALSKKVEYEPTKLNAPKSSTASKIVSPDMVKTRKTRQTRSTKPEASPSPTPEVRVKRKYNRRQAEQSPDALTKQQQPTQKRAYNNTNRARNSESRKALEKSNAAAASKRLKKQKLDVAEMLPQGSPVTSDSSQSESDSSSSSSSSNSLSPAVEKRKVTRSKTLTSSPQNEETLKIKKSLKDNESSSKKIVTASQLFSKTSSANSANNNVISGRIINLSSGFKIPKRPSYEAPDDKSNIVQPEKKAKTDQDTQKPSKQPENSTKSTTPSTLTKTSKSSTNQKVNQIESTNKLHKTNSTERHKIKKPDDSKDTKKSTSSSSDHSKKTKTPKMDLQESDLFMEALGTSKSSSSSSRKHKPLKLAAASALIKKPTPIPVPTSATTALTESAQNLSPVEKSPAAIAASQTLNILNTNRDSNNSETSEPTLTTSSELPTSVATVPTPNGQSKSNLTEPGVKKVTKKKVVWADTCSKLLEQVSYFYLDESERENKKAAFKGGDFDKIEKLNEKELKFKHHEDEMIVPDGSEISLPWPSLIPLELPDHIVQPEIKSVEHEIQLKREQNILAVLMFKQFLPDSPSEPTDSDNINSNTEGFTSKIIPLDDVTLNQSSEVDNSLEIVNHENEPALKNNHHQLNNGYNDQQHGHYNQKFPKQNNRGNNFNQRHNNYNNNNQMGFNNKHQHHHQKRQFEQENLQQKASTTTPLSPQQRTAPKLFTPASPPQSPSKAATPLSPPSNAPRLYSKLDESPKPPASSTDSGESSSLINLSTSLLSSDEMTEKIKLILSQINKTPSETTTAETLAETEQPKVADLTHNKPENNYNNYNSNNKGYNNNYNNYNNMPSGSNYNPDYKKASKWSTPASNFNNNQKMNQNQDNRNNNFNNNTNNQRNSFQNNYRRGIGNRGDMNTHSNFNNRNNNNNYHNNGKPFNRGGGAAGNNNNNTHDNFRNNKNFNNHSRFEHKRDYGRENGKHFRDSNFENDSFAKKKDSKGGAANSAGNGGQWI